jgi:hypothetical protein
VRARAGRSDDKESWSEVVPSVVELRDGGPRVMLVRR